MTASSTASEPRRVFILKVQDVAFDISWETDWKRNLRLSSRIIALPTTSNPNSRSRYQNHARLTSKLTHRVMQARATNKHEEALPIHSSILRPLTLSTRPTHVHIMQRAMLRSPLNPPSMIRQSPNFDPPPQKPLRNFLHRARNPQERPPVFPRILAQRLPANTSAVCTGKVHDVNMYHLVQQCIEKLRGTRLCNHTRVESDSRACESVAAVYRACHPGCGARW